MLLVTSGNIIHGRMKTKDRVRRDRIPEYWKTDAGFLAQSCQKNTSVGKADFWSFVHEPMMHSQSTWLSVTYKPDKLSKSLNL